MVYTQSHAKAIQQYRMKNREKIREKQREYSKTHYGKNKSSINERHRNNYHFKQVLKILIDDVPPPPAPAPVVTCH
jgi:hypothetical protein